MAAPMITALDPVALLQTSDVVASELAENAEHYDRTAEFPFENFARLRDAGILNLTVAERYGGQQAGLELACSVVERIAMGEPSTALVYAMHLIYHALPARTGAWNALAHERMCRDALTGIALVNVMRVEPELGTPTRGGLPATTAHRTPAGWLLTGRKMYATGSPMLSYFITWARTADDDPLVGWFAVPRDAPGWRIEKTWDHMGMRATGSDDLVLEGVEIAEEFALDVRPPAAWLRPDPVQAAWNNLVLASLYHGIAKQAARWLKGYLHERKPANLGASLATLPRHQSAVGELEALLFTSDRLIHGLATEIDREGSNAPAASKTSMAKYVVTNNAVKVVDIAMSLIGNPGLSRTNPLERHHRDVLCSRIHMPQDDMVLLMTGKSALGIQ